MILKFYNASGRQVGYTTTTPGSERVDRAWGINYYKGVTRVVTQINGKAARTHIIITRS